LLRTIGLEWLSHYWYLRAMRATIGVARNNAPATQARAIRNDSTRQYQARDDGKDQKPNWKTRQQSILAARSYPPSGYDRPLRIADMRTARVIYGCWSVMFIPLADRLNRSPPVWECSLMTTPFLFLR
jgi:hypothetical protein